MIYDIVSSNDFTLSFELFPPRHDDSDDRYRDVYNRCEDIIRMKPAYISVTHRAGNSFDETFKICMLAKSYGVPVVAHMRARDTSFDEARVWGIVCRDNGIAVMPVTGDEYKGPVKNIDGYTTSYESTDKHCFENSADLTQFLSHIEDLELLGTWYDEPLHDTKHGDMLCKKAYYGVNVFVSQMLFNPGYVEPNVPKNAVYVPGILPILSTKSYVIQSKQVTIPKDFYTYASIFSVDDGSAGTYYAIYEIETIKQSGVKHVHLFTMDNVDATRSIQKEVMKDE